VPLATPMIAGPSVLATLLVLVSTQPGQLWNWFAALLIAWSITAAVLLCAPAIARVLKEKGSLAVERLMGMLLVMVAVQMFLNWHRALSETLTTCWHASFPWIEYWIAVAVCAIAAVLAAEGKRMDLFGVMVLALVTAVGGGTIRDLCLGVRPVFWIEQPHHVWTALIAAVVTFVAARFVHMPEKMLSIADAFGLALFGIAGTEKALAFGAPGIVAILLGIVTGVAGGILRDVLRGELPLVFQPDVKPCMRRRCSSARLVFVLLQKWLPPSESHRYIGMAVILVLRLAAMRWRLRAADVSEPIQEFWIGRGCGWCCLVKP
jgi:uncharacterized membrane protein YeiH